MFRRLLSATVFVALIVLGTAGGILAPVTSVSAQSQWIDYELYPTSYPSEHYNSEATSTAPNGGPLATANIASVAASGYPGGLFFLTRSPSELYLLAGNSGATNYISKVNPTTLAEISRTSLDCPSSDCPYNLSWYPSGTVHANGYIYVVTESRIWKLDNNINVVAYYNLPIKDGFYNTLKVLSDGNLVAKGFGQPGGPDDRSSLTIVDPNLKAVVPEYILPEVSQARISVLVHNGMECIYIVGNTTLIRLIYSAAFNPIVQKDATWSYQYRNANDSTTTPANPATFIGNQAYFVDNMIRGATGPIHLYRVALDNPADAQKFTPFPGTSSGYHYAKHLVDPINNVIVVSDSANRLLGGFRYLGNGAFSTLWSRTGIESTAVPSASSATQSLYIDDISTAASVAILNILTGVELKRVRTASLYGTSLSVGMNNDVFFTGGPTSVVTRVYSK